MTPKEKSRVARVIGKQMERERLEALALGDRREQAWEEQRTQRLTNSLDKLASKWGAKLEVDWK